MSEVYSKLYSSIIESSIWVEPLATRVVWITLLAKRNMRGEWFGSILGLAKQAGVTVEDAQIAIDTFLAPDRFSRTPDYEGRRIEPIPGGWRLLNHARYNRDIQEVNRAAYKKAWDRDNRPSGHARRSDKKSDGPTVGPGQSDRKSDAQSDKGDGDRDT